jgi:hypothetical protein
MRPGGEVQASRAANPDLEFGSYSRGNGLDASLPLRHRETK